jgi:hypothetical protein
LHTNEIIEAAGLGRTIFSSKYRVHLLRLKLIEYDDLTRRFRLSELGKEVANTRDDIILLSRSKNIRHLDIEPKSRSTGFLPVTVGIYLSEEMKWLEDLVEDEVNRVIGKHSIETGHSMGFDALDMIVSGFVHEVISKFEGLFENRLFNMAEAWRDYLIQQKAKSMNEKSRRKFLSQFSRKIRIVTTSGGQIVERERDIMTHEFPEGEPVLSPEALLDFEAAVTVSISPESAKEIMGENQA